VTTWRVDHGDCLELMRAMPDASVDAVVTDPPYGLSFMGKKWDYDVPSVEVWAECLRVLKPGGHLLAFAGTRTQHRMAVRIEDAGFEIRDMIAWVYSTGFPKSHNISKAIDKAAGAEREVVGQQHRPEGRQFAEGASGFARGAVDITAPATPAARQWQGWGTALKPALEPITMARKPLIGTVAANVMQHGTGAVNVDGCRVPHGADVDLSAVQRQQAEGTGHAVGKGFVGSMIGKDVAMYKPLGRWPANLIHDGSDDVLAGFPGDRPGMSSGGQGRRDASMFGVGGISKPEHFRGDSGSAARFFYCPKASKADREAGLDGMEVNGCGVGALRDSGRGKESTNHHPTVKPTALMQYLCRLITPPGGTVLDPFTGSGSTGKAAMLEGFNFVGFEREAEYVEIARRRIAEAAARPMLEGIK
jgi:site-specific DNA-methyltransferase (adenine-specific)